MLKVMAATPESTGLGEIGAHAARAEAMGFDGLQVPDAINDGLLLSALALQATRRLTVTTSVLVAFPRSPMTVAIAAWGLQKMSGGRFELGLGSQIRQNIEERYSTSWDAPVARMREYVQALKAIFHSFQEGERLNFLGEHYRFTRLQPFFNPGPIDWPAPPVLCGAVGPDMTRMVGRVADGLITHPTNTPPDYLRQVCLPRLEEGRLQAGRRPDAVQRVLGPLVATGRDEGVVAREWERQRQRLGFLYSTPAYWPALELLGWPEVGPRLQRRTREGRWAEMAEGVTDAMMEKIVPRGSYEDIAGVLRERYAGLASAIAFPMPEDPADDGLAADAIARLRQEWVAD